MIWRINRESVLLLGSSCALMMQIAHPLVAAGVDDHSDFVQNPVRRFTRTVDLTMSMVFGTRAQAMAAVRQIGERHRPVKGVLKESAGGLREGAAYSAADPELLLWVHATLVYTALTTYERFVAPLTEAQRDGYFTDTKKIGALLGVPPGSYPSTWRGFREYVQEMMTDGPVQVGPTARRLARAILRPRLRWVPPPALGPIRVITTGLLPPPLRLGYGLSWGKPERAAFHLAQLMLPRLVTIAPERIRTLSYARSARRRLTAA
jgi:uncharacterized protein (DUF2236 family)